MRIWWNFVGCDALRSVTVTCAPVSSTFGEACELLDRRVRHSAIGSTEFADGKPIC